VTEIDARLAAIRAGVPVTEKLAFLNAGSHGPLTAAAGEVIVRLTQEEVREGRLGAVQFARTGQLRNETRDQFARVLGCRAEDIALTTSTTAGMDIACLGLDWRPGDEVITTTAEHMGGLGILYVLEHRYGVRLRFADLSHGNQALLDSIQAAAGERTRAIVLSHVSWSSGLVLPVADVCAIAGRWNALVIVDGAQSAGAIPVDVGALGVDAYAAPGQKWLCGPEGYGALYISPNSLDRFEPAFTGSAGFAEYDWAGRYVLRHEAVRFNMPGSPFVPGLAGMKASLRWFLDEVGPEWAYRRTVENAARCRSLLEAIEGVEVLTPPGRHAGLLHFTVAGWDPAAVYEELLQRNVLVRNLLAPSCIRASTGFYNSDDDIEALAGGIRDILSLPPHPPASISD
jgi:L-cysteine/cystine lyase